MEYHIEKRLPPFRFHLPFCVRLQNLHFCAHADQKWILTKGKLSNRTRQSIEDHSSFDLLTRIVIARTENQPLD